MNIFITGSNGFVGSHLKEYLGKNYANYTLFAPSSRELDLADEAAVDKYILSNKIDIIIHLANRGGGRGRLRLPEKTHTGKHHARAMATTACPSRRQGLAFTHSR